MEDEEDGLFSEAEDLLDMGLVAAQTLGAELDVAGLVDTVDVAEAGSDGEVGRDLAEILDDVLDILGLGVEGVVINVLVVDTILLATSDTNLHLEPLLHGSGALKVLGSGLDVPLDGLLGEIDHVRGEEGLPSSLEVGLVGVKHTIEPGQELLGAVVGVEDDGDAVGGGDGADVVGSGNRASNGGRLVAVGKTLDLLLANGGIARRRYGAVLCTLSLPCRRSRQRHPGTAGG